MSRIRTFWAWAIEGAIGNGQRWLAWPPRVSVPRRHSHGRAHEVRQLTARPLEPRRLLDAALPGVLSGAPDFSMLDHSTPGGTNDTIQVGSAQAGEFPGPAWARPALATVTGTPAELSLAGDGALSSLGYSAAATVNMTPRSVIVAPWGPAYPYGEAAENETVHALFAFRDPDWFDTHTLQVDWGDGSAVETWTLSVGQRWGVVSHQYLDDNPSGTSWDVNQVRMTVRDSHDATATGSGDIRINNVGPLNLQLALLDPIDEGSMANLQLTFEDPGTLDAHQVRIDWDDGSGVETWDVAPGSRTLGADHTYADNGLYTIRVQLFDDDLGVIAGSVQQQVRNVDPTLLTLAGTDIDRLGETTLSGSFIDPGNDTFVLQIDWRDGSIEQVPLGGPTPRDFSVTHRYFGPPDPLNPAADVEIGVRLLDDDRGFDTGLVAVSNTGDGTQPVRIDTTPQVPRLTFPRPAVVPPLPPSNLVSLENGSAADISSAVGDTKTIGERYFVLRVITPEGKQGAGYRLETESLQDLPGLFRKLPDNHYAIYLVRPETETYRLVLEVNVRNGKVIDPGDDSDGARDRPPTESTHESVQPADKRSQEDDSLPVDSAVPPAPATPTTPQAPTVPAAGNDVTDSEGGIGSAEQDEVALFRANFFDQTPNTDHEIGLLSQGHLGIAAGGIWLASAGSGEGRSAARLSAGAWYQEERAREADRQLADTSSVRWRRLRRLARQRQS